MSAAAEIARALPERIVLALTLWAEGRSETVDGRIAIGCTIRNRRKLRRQSVIDVCLAPNQYSCWIPEGGTANHRALEAVTRAIADGAAVTDAVLVECLWIADGILSAACRDLTHGADHYVTTELLSSNAKPKWLARMAWTATVGRHAFYRS